MVWKNSLNAANIAANFSVKLSTAISIGVRLSNFSCAAVEVVLSAPVLER